MFIAKVVGNVWATRKHPVLEGKKLMLIQPVDEISLRQTGEVQLAVDIKTGAGVGDTVIIIDEGNACSQILGYERAPVRAIIAGIVDSVYRKGKSRKYH